MQEAYEALVVKHEEFAELIQDDIEFEEQEAWLTESQDMFMRLEIDAKLYLESTKDLEKEIQVKESQPSDNKNSTNLSSSELRKSSITRSNEVTSNDLVTEENSSSNEAIVNVVDNSRDRSGSGGMMKRETCGFKWKSRKCLNSPVRLENTQSSEQISSTRLRLGTVKAPWYS